MLTATKLRFYLPLLLSVQLLVFGLGGSASAAAVEDSRNRLKSTDPAPIKLVTQHFPPFSYIEQGQVAGPARELLDLVCKAMQQPCQHQLLPWGRAQRLVQKGQADGMYVIGWNPERSRELFYSVPLLSTEYGFFVRGDDPLHRVDPESLAGYRVAVLGASNTLSSLQSLLQLQHRFEIIPVTDSETAFRLLNAARVDTVYSNRDVGLALIRQQQQGSLHYAVAHRRLAYYVGFSRDRVKLEWVEAFNRQLDRIHQQGKVVPLLRRYGLE